MTRPPVAECELCTSAAARACPDPRCRERRLGEPAPTQAHTTDHREDRPMPDTYVTRALDALTAECPDLEPELARLYTLLVLVRGRRTTLADVHDAWALWRMVARPDHPNLVPFDELPTPIQERDRPYVEAVHRAAATLGDYGGELDTDEPTVAQVVALEQLTTVAATALEGFAVAISAAADRIGAQLAALPDRPDRKERPTSPGGPA